MKRLVKVLFIPAAMMISAVGFAQVNNNMQNTSPPMNNTMQPQVNSPSQQPGVDPMQQQPGNFGTQNNGILPSHAQQQIQEHARDSVKQAERKAERQKKKAERKARKESKKSKWHSGSGDSTNDNQSTTPDENPPQ
jgi:hypothetical protein